MNKKHQISYIKQNEPSFLKDFKKRAGYKEGPTIDDKKKELPRFREEDGEDRPDEQPQIVLMNAGDLTEAEVASLKEELKEKKKIDNMVDLSSGTRTQQNPEYDSSSGSKTEEECDQSGKIVFRKPAKRSATEALSSSTKVAPVETTDKKLKAESSMEKVRNTNLLSFEDDDD